MASLKSRQLLFRNRSADWLRASPWERRCFPPSLRSGSCHLSCCRKTALRWRRRHDSVGFLALPTDNDAGVPMDDVSRTRLDGMQRGHSDGESCPLPRSLSAGPEVHWAAPLEELCATRRHYAIMKDWRSQPWPLRTSCSHHCGTCRQVSLAKRRPCSTKC